MITLEGIKRFYFIGIGGIGMSALARYFHAKGFDVAGYDKTPSPLIDELIAEGMLVHFEDLGSSLPEAYLDTESTLVVYTPAIPKDLGELRFVQTGHKVLKRSEVLGLITQSSKGLGVAGTHGKTTTSTMLAYVMSQSSVPCSAFLGGISTNFQSNVLVDPKAVYSVIEADEFDRSFLRLSPFASIITAMDPDHLDIYGDERSFQDGFNQYAQKHATGGLIVYRYGLPLKTNGLHTKTYGVEEHLAFSNGKNLRYENGGFFMDIQCGEDFYPAVELGLPGKHNAENALAVWTLCLDLGLSEKEIRTGLAGFRGVKRRFDVHVKKNDLVYIDDYAHHPTEISALISSVRQQYPDKQIIGIFQPHLFSRTRDFIDGFVTELARLDQAIIMPIYPARELPIDGVTSDVLVERIGSKAELMEPESVIAWAKSVEQGVVLTIGAGDIDRIVPELSAIFKENCEK